MPRDYTDLSFDELYEMRDVSAQHPKWNVDEVYEYNARQKRVAQLGRLKEAASGNLDAIPYAELEVFRADEQGKNGKTAREEVQAILNPDRAAADAALQGYMDNLSKMAKLYDDNHAPKPADTVPHAVPGVQAAQPTVQAAAPAVQAGTVVEESGSVPTYGSANARVEKDAHTLSDISTSIGAFTPASNTSANPTDETVTPAAPTAPPSTGSEETDTETEGEADTSTDVTGEGDKTDTAGILSYHEWLSRFGTDTTAQQQEALKAAYEAYERSLATYGQRAEDLAQAGLTGSGVSDNMERAAYAQKQSAVQNALAQKNAGDAANLAGYNAYHDTKQAELKAEAEAEQAEKETLQPQYNQLYYQLLEGYTDEEGNVHKAMKDEQAVAYMANLYGYTDEEMLEAAREAYKATTGAADKAREDKAVQIAGGTLDAAGSTIAAESLLGKILSSEIDEDDFLDEIYELTGEEYERLEDGEIPYFEIADDLYEQELISKTQWQGFYEQSFRNGLKVMEENLTEGSLKEDLKSGGGGLAKGIRSIYEAYQKGKLTKEAWDEIRKEILSGEGEVGIAFTDKNRLVAGSNSFSLGLCASVGDQEIKRTIETRIKRMATESLSQKLEQNAKGMNLVTVNGVLYIRAEKLNVFGKETGEALWYEMGDVGGSRKNTIVEILAMLATP